MRASEIFENHKNTEIERETGIERRRVAELKKRPGKITLGELEEIGKAYGFRVVLIAEKENA